MTNTSASPGAVALPASQVECQESRKGLIRLPAVTPRTPGPKSVDFQQFCDRLRTDLPGDSHGRGVLMPVHGLPQGTLVPFFLSNGCMAQRCRCPGGRPSVSANKGIHDAYYSIVKWQLYKPSMNSEYDQQSPRERRYRYWRVQ